MATTNQKYVIDSQKPKRKELKHATKENHPTTKWKKEEMDNYKNNWKTSIKMIINTNLPIITLKSMD